MDNVEKKVDNSIFVDNVENFNYLYTSYTQRIKLYGKKIYTAFPQFTQALLLLLLSLIYKYIIKERKVDKYEN